MEARPLFFFLEYIDAVFPDGVKLYPADPFERAKGRIVIINFSNKVRGDVSPDWLTVAHARKIQDPISNENNTFIICISIGCSSYVQECERALRGKFEQFAHCPR